MQSMYGVTPLPPRQGESPSGETEPHGRQHGMGKVKQRSATHSSGLGLTMRSSALIGVSRGTLPLPTGGESRHEIVSFSLDSRDPTCIHRDGPSESPLGGSSTMFHGKRCRRTGG